MKRKKSTDPRRRDYRIEISRPETVGHFALLILLFFIIIINVKVIPGLPPKSPALPSLDRAPKNRGSKSVVCMCVSVCYIKRD